MTERHRAETFGTIEDAMARGEVWAGEKGGANV